jgi:hypothetical protein
MSKATSTKAKKLFERIAAREFEVQYPDYNSLSPLEARDRAAAQYELEVRRMWKKFRSELEANFTDQTWSKELRSHVYELAVSNSEHGAKFELLDAYTTLCKLVEVARKP